MPSREPHNGRRAQSRLSDAGSVPTGPCPTCEREVLGYLSPEVASRYACVHCDGPLRGVYWVAEDELEELGYDAWDPVESAGCGTGCGSGGCGVGRPSLSADATSAPVDGADEA